MKKTNSLFFKISSAFILVLAAALAVVSITMISITRSKIEKNIKSSLGNLNALLYYNVRDFFTTVNSGLSFTVWLEALPEGNTEQKYGIIMQQVLKKDYFYAADLRDTSGKVLCKTSAEGWNGEIPSSLIKESIKTQMPKLGNIFYMDGKPQMYMSYPLVKGGKVIQTLGIVLSLEELWNTFGSIIPEEGTRLLLVGSDDNIIYPGSQYAVKYSVSKFAADSADVVEYGGDIVAYKKVSIFLWQKNKVLFLIMKQPKSIAFSSIRKMTAAAVIALLISLALGIGASTFLARGLLAPVGDLMNGVGSLSSGDLSGRLKVKTNDEIGVLTAAFNSMLEKLAEFRKKLVDQERLAAVGQMSSIVGHEIRNPLWAISNAVYYLKTKFASDSRAMEMLGVMDRELKVTNKIVDDLLNFARQRPPVLKDTNINALLDESLSVIDIPETVEIAKNYGAAGVLKLDSDEVRQILINLIKNAVQAMPESTGKIKIITSSDAKTTKIQIQDTGSGISPENLKKIFDPFFSTKSKGTGLGLAAVKRIVERHRGTIEAKSQVGKGTVFIIVFPFNLDKILAAGKPAGK